VITSSSLNLRAVLKTAVARSGLDQEASGVSGLSAAAKALHVAVLAHQLTKGTLLYVVASDRDLDQATGDIGFFLQALEGWSSAAVEQAVLGFPSHEIDPYRGLAPHFGVTSARARALHAMARGSARVVVASAAALLPRVSAPSRLLQASCDLRAGQEIAIADLVDLLTDGRFRRKDPVDAHGEFSVRGGIVDVYPAGELRPVRLEFVGDTIESMRAYDPATQRSVAPVDSVSIVPLGDVLFGPGESDDVWGAGNREATVFDYLHVANESRIVVSEPDEVRASMERLWGQLQRSRAEAEARNGPTAALSSLFADLASAGRRLDSAEGLFELGVDSGDGSSGQEQTTHVRCQPAVVRNGRVSDWVAEIRRLKSEGEIILFVAATAGRAERTIEVLKEYDVFSAPVDRAEDAQYASVLVATGRLSRGFRLPGAGLQIFSEADVFDEEPRSSDRHRSARGAFVSDFRDLGTGDLVVHVDHGIGMFAGLTQIGIGDSAQEFLELRYAGDDKLFVPIERLDLVQKYTGATRPPLDRLGGASWERTKSRVKKAMRDMAEELLKLYAARKAVPGHAFSADSHWQREFDDAFEYELTPDQQAAIADITRDMEAPTPMDRLLCGDVGYGKTEVAMRAAFKAVMDGKQVAVLAPTTVLAFQHLKTFRERFAGFPVRVEMVSRFRSRAEQKAAIEDLAAGKVDIMVGTHRLLSRDVEFRDLGLLVVDEEQRFGVAHKERIKQLKRRVDVLTMTATPIPRTLNMSLVGIRDMSIIETPPKDRLSIQTSVLKFDQHVIERAIRSELERGGQVFFVHNRVESIFSIGHLLQRLVPEARIVVGHGQMSEEALERAMLDFIARRHDVLLATTIVENGLDIPNANTIIINRADRYGLAQLYQLRGRVGRSDRPAYAYLLVPPADSLSPVAKKRLAAIREFSDLGSGFRVAALDLEIRGAGNLLGGEQSGHIETVGFEMYMKLLDQTVRELKGEELEDDVRADVNLRVDLRIDESYVPDVSQRLVLYRKVAAARRQEQIASVLEEAVDRYGPPPASLLNLAEYGRIRVMADQLGLEAIDREGTSVVLRFRPQAKLDPVRLVSLVRERSDLSLVPPASLRLNLAPEVGVKTVSRPAASVSWWTARARAGTVTPGFSKAEMLRLTREDPRTRASVFEQVGGLLSELLGRM
jgi:transcription-repair coupling factor (superfamily II helicase)